MYCRIWPCGWQQNLSCRAKCNFRGHGGQRVAYANSSVDWLVIFSPHVAPFNQFTYALLSGYIPTAEALSAVEKLASRLRHDKPNLIYLLDRMLFIKSICLWGVTNLVYSAVMGDAGRLYVSPDVVPVYRQMLPLATIITPNWFEVECVGYIVHFPHKWLRLRSQIINKGRAQRHAIPTTRPRYPTQATPRPKRRHKLNTPQTMAFLRPSTFHPPRISFRTLPPPLYILLPLHPPERTYTHSRHINRACAMRASHPRLLLRSRRPILRTPPRTFPPQPRATHDQRHPALRSRLAGPHQNLRITPHDTGPGFSVARGRATPNRRRVGWGRPHEEDETDEGT